MFINYLLLLCALSLSTVSAYYSVIGLTTIFAGAFWPVVIMGGILETSKIVVSSWLYRKWKIVPTLLRSYLTTAVIILMIITSIGIFGFLSKAHIEQTGQIKENQAQIERLDSDIARQKQLQDRAEQKLKQLESIGTGSDVNIQNQITTEQQRIDNSYKRIQPAIDEQNKIIESQTKIIADQIADIDKQLQQLQSYIDSKEITKAQALVGTKPDGDWGPGTAAAVKNWQQSKRDEKTALVQKLEDINKNNVNVKMAREEIQRLRQTAEVQINESNKLINRLREQIGKTKAEDVGVLITEQQTIVKNTTKEIDTLYSKKFDIESQYRKLEAEVGPIKYIANFIYNAETDKNILEKSVTWMIIAIIFVFDPLAVLMLIAANLGFTEKTTSSNGEQESHQKKSLKKFLFS
jgi:peptidoglycan hydrolase-like protein with peptidoglycan-binding domain